MKLDEVLAETPQIIGDYTPIELYDTSQNQDLYQQLKHNPNKQLLKSISDTCNVYISNKTVFCLDDVLAMVTYEMEFKVNTNAIIGTFVWQTSVWRGNSALISHLPTEIFFDYLVHNCHTVLTDSKQSWDGKRFWLDRIDNSFDKKLNVYYFDFSNNHLQKMNSKQEWLQFYKTNQTKIWGNSDLHQMKRMIITDKEL
jgi:hypothetical protein